MLLSRQCRRLTASDACIRLRFASCHAIIHIKVPLYAQAIILLLYLLHLREIITELLDYFAAFHAVFI